MNVISLYGNKTDREKGPFIKSDSEKPLSDSEKHIADSEKMINDSQKYDFDSEKPVKMTVKERNQLILDMLAHDNSLTVKKLSEQIGVSESSINRDLKLLRESNSLRYEGSAKKGKWIVINKDI